MVLEGNYPISKKRIEEQRGESTQGWKKGNPGSVIVIDDQQLPAAQLMDNLGTPIEFDPDIFPTNSENSISVLHRFAP